MADQQASYCDPTENSFPDDYDLSKVDSRIVLRSKSVRKKQKGKDVRGALAQGIEIAGAVAGESVQSATDAKTIADDTRKRFDDQIAGSTNDDEVIDARRPKNAEQAYQTLGKRLDAQDLAVRAAKVHDQFQSGQTPIWDKLAIHAWDGITFGDPLFDTVVENIKKAGITKWRFGINWKTKYASKKSGSYDFSYEVEIVKKMITVGITPIVYIEGTPDGLSYDDLVAGAKDFVVKAVQSLSRLGVIWESWNEPNFGFWFSWSNAESVVQDWVDVDNAMGAAVRQYDPGALFLVGAFSVSTDYRDNADQYLDWGTKAELAVKLGLLKYADAVSIHPYQLTAEPEDFLKTNLNIERMKAIIAKYSRATVPVVITEFGYSTTNVEALNAIDEETQANWLTRGIFILDYLNVPLITIFAYLVNTNKTDDAECGFGIYRADGTTPKPAATLLLKLLGQLDGFQFAERINTSGTGYFVMRYVDSDTNSKLVYWHDASVVDTTVVIDGATLSLTEEPQITDGKAYVSAKPIKYAPADQALVSETFGFSERTVRHLPAGTDLNNVLDQGIYLLDSNDYKNVPKGNGYGILQVVGSIDTLGHTDAVQLVYHTWDGQNPAMFRTRHNQSGKWFNWLTQATASVELRKTYTNFVQGTGSMLMRVVNTNVGKSIDISLSLSGLGADIQMATVWSGTTDDVPLAINGNPVWFELRDPNNHQNGRVFYLGTAGSNKVVLTSNAVIGSPTASTQLRGVIRYDTE